MSTRIAATLATALAVAFIPQASAKGGTATLLPASDVKWVDVPDSPGVKLGALQGDPAKGAAHFLIKLPGGFVAPEHHHSADHYVTVISGTMSFTVDGKDTKLPAGSYFAYTGKKTHLTKCEAGADCVLSVDARGKWDVIPEGAKPAEKKKAAEKKPAAEKK
jgi:quercetin dioxygenase-like cupin family protein